MPDPLGDPFGLAVHHGAMSAVETWNGWEDLGGAGYHNTIQSSLQAQHSQSRPIPRVVGLGTHGETNPGHSPVALSLLTVKANPIWSCVVETYPGPLPDEWLKQIDGVSWSDLGKWVVVRALVPLTTSLTPGFH
jgi:hypothetical protein